MSNVAKFRSQYDQQKDRFLRPKYIQTTTAQASKVTNKLTSEEPRGQAYPPSAVKHRDDVNNNIDSLTRKPEDLAKSSAKVKNVPVENEDSDDTELDVTDLHRKIVRYCDLHGKPGNEFLDWIGRVDSGNPKIKESLDKTSDNYPGGTLLHAIARGPQQTIEQVVARFERRYELLRWLCENYPQLYAERDLDERTVLEEMIWKSIQTRSKGLNPFVEYFVKEFPAETARQVNKDNENLATPLQIPICHLIPMICSPELQGAGCLGALLPYLNEDTLREMDDDKNTVLHLAARYKYSCGEEPESQQMLKEHIENLIQTYPNMISSFNNNKESPYLHRVNTAREYLTKKGVDPLTQEPDVVTHFLKDLCMHRPIEEAVGLLYGPRLGPDQQISLNLQELSRGRGTITKRKLIKFLDRFHFESILQYVQIPRLTLAPEKPSTSTTERPTKAIRRHTSLTDGIGREECLAILDYLREKGVRKIIELIVDDNQDPPHKDTIIATLETFDLEIFDWKKLDLCSDTVFEAAPHANKIVLYSSSNNAVLKSWSAIDGLARFQRLTEVHVHVYQRIESSATTKDMITRFRERMAKNCPQVSSEKLVILQIKSTKQSIMTGVSGGNVPGGSELVSLNINTWMSTMEQFALFIRNIPDTELPPDRRPIKVAVIDDGIDAVYNEEKFSNTLKGGESFCTGSKRPPYYFSSTGHGTLMADLVQRVCPKVHLYVARLDEVQGDTSVQPTAESAANAIKWAIEQDVDIISMSWTITSKYEHILRPVIQEADRKNILMFGAASDQGYNLASKVYPAEYEQVFCIGAAKSTGRADSAAELQAKYVFPGGEWSDIKAAQGVGDGSLDHAWGSSFATALASGLAALILDCTELVGYGNSYRQIIRTRESMDAIFAGMVREKESKYIPVTQHFTAEVAAGSWDTEGKQKFKKAIKNILRPVID